MTKQEYCSHQKNVFPQPLIIILGFSVLSYSLHRSITGERDLNYIGMKPLQLRISYVSQVSFIAKCFSD